MGIAVGSANEIGNDGDAALFGSREEEWVGATVEKEVCNAQTADGAGEKERGIAVSRAEIGVHVVDAEQRHDLEVVQLDGDQGVAGRFVGEIAAGFAGRGGCLSEK